MFRGYPPASFTCDGRSGSYCEYNKVPGYPPAIYDCVRRVGFLFIFLFCVNQALFKRIKLVIKLSGNSVADCSIELADILDIVKP